ncbi:MAG: hypothetical protein HYV34_03295 [Candidatus Kerfeldbacteria bacterium]|nr:hypothetical protein [Candidatus Kerfeldbacteria bacterium]
MGGISYPHVTVACVGSGERVTGLFYQEVNRAIRGRHGSVERVREIDDFRLAPPYPVLVYPEMRYWFLVRRVMECIATEGGSRPIACVGGLGWWLLIRLFLLVRCGIFWKPPWLTFWVAWMTPGRAGRAQKIARFLLQNGRTVVTKEDVNTNSGPVAGSDAR